MRYLHVEVHCAHVGGYVREEPYEHEVALREGDVDADERGDADVGRPDVGDDKVHGLFFGVIVSLPFKEPFTNP